MVRQGEGYYSLTSNLPFFQQPSRMFNLGAAGFRKAGEWEFSLSGELTHLRTGSGSAQMLAFSPATMVSGELGLRKNHLTAKGRNGLADSLALSIVVPPRAVAGNLRVDYLTPTADGMSLMPTSLVVPLSRLGAEPVRVEGAYRLARAGKWSLDLTGGVNMARAEGLSPVEGMVALRLPLR